MSDEIAVLYTEEQIARRVADLGQEIGRAFAGCDLCVIGITEESIIFVADLVRRVPLDLTMHLMRVRRRPDPPGGVTTEIFYATAATPLADRHVLLVDDVVDTGVTLSYVLGHVREQNPSSLRACCLIDKPQQRKIDVALEWSAFTLGAAEDDRYLVGYGLGWQQRFRGLPYLATIPRPAALTP
jgi:hypoxanthine phosphoribosyltransferase